MKRTTEISKMLVEINDIKCVLGFRLQSMKDTLGIRSDAWIQGSKGEELIESIHSLQKILKDIDSAYCQIEDLYEKL